MRGKRKCAPVVTPVQDPRGSDSRIHPAAAGIELFGGQKSDENLRSSFGIYPTDYEEDYAYCLVHATLVQEENVEESV